MCFFLQIVFHVQKGSSDPTLLSDQYTGSVNGVCPMFLVYLIWSPFDIFSSGRPILHLHGGHIICMVPDLVPSETTAGISFWKETTVYVVLELRFNSCRLVKFCNQDDRPKKWGCEEQMEQWTISPSADKFRMRLESRSKLLTRKYMFLAS